MDVINSETEVMCGGFAIPNNKRLNIKLKLFTTESNKAQEFILSSRSVKKLINSLQKSLDYLNEGAEILAGGTK